MGNHRKISINLDKIHDIALRGIRRTYVFLGLGLNAAKNPDFNEFHLNTRYTIRLMPEEVSDKHIADFKRNFELWIIANGLRELIESFSVFLSAIYHACLIVDTAKGGISSQTMQSRKIDFDQKGVGGQLNKLAADYEITCPFADHFDSLTRARNCYAHRLGVVGPRDCNGGDTLILKWRAPEFLIMDNAGKEIVVSFDFQEPFHVEAGGTVGIRVVDKEKVFQRGTPIAIDQTELLEICLTALFATNDIRDSTLDFLKSRDVPIRSGDQP